MIYVRHIHIFYSHIDGLERLRTGDISKLPPKAADELYPNGKDIKWK